MYRTLASKYIVSTLETLSRRIQERFPGSSLGHVSEELLQIARQSEGRMRRLRRPRWLVRLGTLAITLTIVALAAAAVVSVQVKVDLLLVENVAELAQGLEAVVNEIILLALALFFVGSLEGRIKRREALAALHELRSIAHVIDMHQLTKDPEVVVTQGTATPSSPERTLTPFLLSRYLDYCSELLSLVSKLSALYAQHMRDAVVLAAVNDLESLTDGLSRKIWQKLIVLGAGLSKRQDPAGADPH